MTDGWAALLETRQATAALLLGALFLGVAWGRWRAAAVLSAVWIGACLASDLLYLILGVNVAGYCGEPRCDPGPIPLTYSDLYLVVLVPLVALGVAARRLAGARAGRK